MRGLGPKQRTPSIKLLALSVLGSFALLASPASAEKGAAEKVKAAFIFNFLKFIKLPLSSGGTIDLCVLTHDPYIQEYQALQGRTASDTPIQVIQMSEFPRGHVCDVLYVHRTFKQEVQEGLAALRKGGVLTIGERESFLDEGGVIRFLVENDRIRFDVDLDNARANHLQASAGLLRVARVVRSKKGGSP